MICRLCLDNSENLFGLFESEGMALNAVYIVSKHFWFEPKPNDVMSNSICRNCWHMLESFHLFYVQIENSHKKFSENISLMKIDPNDMIVPKEDNDNIQNDINNDNSNDDFVEDFDAIWNDQNKSEDIALCEDIKNEPETLTKKRTRQSLYAKPPVEYNENSNDENSFSLIKEETPTKRKTKLKTKDGTTRDSQAKNDKPKKCRNKKSVEEVAAINKRLADEDVIIAKFMKVYCNVCTIEQKNFSTLKKHCTVKHRQKGFVVCCDKKYFKRFLLVDHIEKHLNPESYKCNFCEKNFTSRWTLRDHIQFIHKNVENNIYFKCSHCDKSFTNKNLMLRHQLFHIPEEERQFKCTECEKAFPSKATLDCHVRIEHEKRYAGICDICGKSYKNKADLKRHRWEQHEGDDKPKIQCKFCDLQFLSRYTYQLHKNNDHKHQNVEQKCQICEKMFPNTEALKSHIRYTHNAKPKFQCNICEKVFKRQLVLKEHMAVHTGQPLYACPHCPKTFTHSSNMHHHRKRVHPKEFAEARQIQSSKKESWCKITALKS